MNIGNSLEMLYTLKASLVFIGSQDDVIKCILRNIMMEK